MENIFDALTPGLKHHLWQMAALCYLGAFGATSALRLVNRVVFLKAPWRPFFTSPVFLTAAAGAIIAAGVYLFLPAPPPADPPIDPDAIILWGLNDALVRKLIENVATMAWGGIVLFAGALSLMKAFVSRLSANPPSHRKFWPFRLFVLVIVPLICTWNLILQGRAVDQAVAKLATNTTQAELLAGLSKLQIVYVAEILILAIVGLVILAKIARPAWQGIRASGIGVFQHAHPIVSALGWVFGVVFALLSIWRIYQIFTLQPRIPHSRIPSFRLSFRRAGLRRRNRRTGEGETKTWKPSRSVSTSEFPCICWRRRSPIRSWP